MQIVDKTPEKHIVFSSLEIGECFYWNNDLYLRIESDKVDCGTVLNLRNYRTSLVAMKDNMPVRRVKSVLTIS